MSDLELERKWLVQDAPLDVMSAPAEPIQQGYLAIGSDGSEVRLRRRGAGCTLTAKSGSGLARRELEVELTDEQFEALWPGTEGRRLEKTRRAIEIDGDLRLELDEYAGELAGLVVVEVEFPSEQAARSFPVPGWFGLDVTDRDEYKNRQLALAERPPANC